MITPNRDRASVIAIRHPLSQRMVDGPVLCRLVSQLRFCDVVAGRASGIRPCRLRPDRRAALLPGPIPEWPRTSRTLNRLVCWEPPGFLAMNYGYQTPLATVPAHLAYGAVLGGFYRV
ncbi:MAG: hypothetical protein A4E19_13685 [Nitrospira sp. SG-bin1]|nr:MAG: hypothetical protein A4E19_13685 [Nitrospira sp. SG-bin1]